LSKLYENHRPTTKEEIVGQEEAVDEFFGLLDNKLVTDFLFSGPSGCGKTTAARVAAMYLWPEDWTERYHEFNASDDRGIVFVREKIKELAKFSYPKIIVLDEADSMTEDAYEALRKPIEGSSNTIFILCVNNLGKILPAIQSRCKIIRFKPLTNDDIWTVMISVMDKEGIEYDLENEKVQQMLVRISDIARGDLRIAIQELAGYLRQDGGKLILHLDRPVESAPNITYIVLAIKQALEGNLQEAIQSIEDALLVDRIIPNKAIEEAFEYARTIDNQVVRAEVIVKLAELDKSLKTSYPLIQYAGFVSYVWLVGSMTKGDTNA
jgi:DNA polymerase III delta prime subunit